MNRNQTIKIARAVRNYPSGIAEGTLVWRVSDSKLGVEYRHVSIFGDINCDIPDLSVRSWFWTFVRPQGQLQLESYYLVSPPTEAWREIIEGILKHV